MSATYAVYVDWDNDGDFVTAGDDISADVMKINIDRGFSDGIARVATVGRCDIVVKNTGKEYSPDLQSTVLPRRQVLVQMPDTAGTGAVLLLEDGFALLLETGDNLLLESSIPTLFRGYLDSIEPVAGIYGSRRATLQCVDAIALFQDAEILIALQESKRGDELISSVVTNVYTPPGTAYDTDVDTFPYTGDRWTADYIVYGAGKQQRALAAIRDVCTSDWGRFYIRSDGYPTFENRQHRTSDVTSVATLADTMSQLQYTKGMDLLFNEIKVTAYPRTIGAANEVLWAQEAGSIPSVAAGASLTISAKFRDPNNKEVSIGGKTVVPPVVTTDYLMNAASDGSGANLTANFTVVATVYANNASILITNTGGTDGYITLLQIRGLAVRAYAPPTVTASDSTSQTTYKSKRTLPLDLVLQDNVNTATTLAAYLLGLYKDPPGQVAGAMFYADRNSTFSAYAQDLDVGDRITLSEAQTGISGDFFINAIRHVIDVGRSHRVTVDVEPAGLGGPYFQLDVSQLDGTHVLMAV